MMISATSEVFSLHSSISGEFSKVTCFFLEWLERIAWFSRTRAFQIELSGDDACVIWMPDESSRPFSSFSLSLDFCIGRSIDRSGTIDFSELFLLIDFRVTLWRTTPWKTKIQRVMGVSELFIRRDFSGSLDWRRRRLSDLFLSFFFQDWFSFDCESIVFPSVFILLPISRLFEWWKCSCLHNRFLVICFSFFFSVTIKQERLRWISCSGKTVINRVRCFVSLLDQLSPEQYYVSRHQQLL